MILTYRPVTLFGKQYPEYTVSERGKVLYRHKDRGVAQKWMDDELARRKAITDAHAQRVTEAQRRARSER